MSAYSITASAVKAYDSSVSPNGGGKAGEAIAAGEFVYIKASDGKVYKAQADGTSAEAVVVGMAANSAAADQPVSYFTNDQEVVVDSALFASAGLFLHLSATAGKADPPADAIATNSYVTQLGYATATNRLKVKILATGIQA